MGSLLEACGPEGALEKAVGAFIDTCIQVRCHESLSNVTPADVPADISFG